MAKPGDALILTKPLGVGIYSAALKQGLVDDAAYAEMLASTTLLNRIGAELGGRNAVHAVTDVTGFGILGHAVEMARGSGATLRIEADALPLLSRATEWVQAGLVTGASRRNWASYGDSIRLSEALPEWRRHLLTDPQTSGGLLVSCAATEAEALAAEIRAAGYPLARRVGQVSEGPPRVEVV
jgi:selenide,water dikinase